MLSTEHYLTICPQGIEQPALKHVRRQSLTGLQEPRMASTWIWMCTYVRESTFTSIHTKECIVIQISKVGIIFCTLIGKKEQNMKLYL